MTDLAFSDLPDDWKAQGDAASAAQSLVRSFGAPARAHAVWVRTEIEVVNEGQTFVEIFRRVICVARHPKWGAGLTVPVEWEGFRVREEPWPNG